jgi:hypothetical protein
LRAGDIRRAIQTFHTGHDGQVNGLPCLPDWASCLATKSWASLSIIVNELATHVKMHKLLQICKQVVTNLFTSCRQVVFALLVPVVVTSLEKAVNNL